MTRGKKTLRAYSAPKRHGCRGRTKLSTIRGRGMVQKPLKAVISYKKAASTFTRRTRAQRHGEPWWRKRRASRAAWRQGRSRSKGRHGSWRTGRRAERQGWA